MKVNIRKYNSHKELKLNELDKHISNQHALAEIEFWGLYY